MRQSFAGGFVLERGLPNKKAETVRGSMTVPPGGGVHLPPLMNSNAVSANFRDVVEKRRFSPNRAGK